MDSFVNLGLRNEIAQALCSFGFTSPTEIQSLAIPAILAGGDAYVSSATGSGKTFAYLAPLLSLLDPETVGVGALIVAPTHDLAAQLYREANRLIEASGLPFRTVQLLGSAQLQRQKELLHQKPHLVIGSAGRLRDLVSGRFLDTRQCRYIVLDEGDRLFEKEVIDISTDLLGMLPESCARIMVSATIPEKLVQKTGTWFRDARQLFLDSTLALRDSIEHWCFHAASRKKSDWLRRFAAAVKPERCLIFVSSNAALHSLAEKMEHFGLNSAILQTTQAGNDRKSAVNLFAEGQVQWLLSTDLGARGLDIPSVSHVISYDLPEDVSVYVHRAGRTGRAGERGIAIALADLVELKRASKIAVRYGFPFICKILDSGHVFDIEPENFFALAEEAESQKKEPTDNQSKPPARQSRAHYGTDRQSFARPAPRLNPPFGVAPEAADQRYHGLPARAGSPSRLVPPGKPLPAITTTDGIRPVTGDNAGGRKRPFSKSDKPDNRPAQDGSSQAAGLSDKAAGGKRRPGGQRHAAKSAEAVRGENDGKAAAKRPERSGTETAPRTAKPATRESSGRKRPGKHHARNYGPPKPAQGS
ncbi:MAG: hypothetical protein A2087_05830 [Spirochaetes bacterium GWD1_61_31]|nr:MAG: hypothetical protein A2Y37_13690 [Spirochaetes bacterium GWB1_60_80]OHD31522.1 MAG: hypothetical protein A2004_13315 [Spirochaetes bacterium GWC1_61_12]OHD43299.1 MAG: hypothetical protein A2087_05830 [Spirochaetes bacterium GWD1_61_31]OHD45611.1 MAG: hypothetical protein A2Y35_09160 [Spirochaetes bacterium GWE1_60_18]OHD60462.1 MAG: hypothetical protein A2Y32_02850 [Spirochaetes bacterium GWF1_60_12]HAW85690.1 hypothetical protein [Spirochaetaceae bacterium]